MGNMTRTKSTSSGSDLTCPHCSSTVDETTNSIGCDKCGCWVHHTCTKIPTEALTYMSTEGVFWFCNDCTKAVKKLVRLKTTTEMEFKEDINNSLQEIKSTLSDLKAKSTYSIIPPQLKLPNVNTESSPKIDTSLEIKISGIPEFSSQPNSKYSDIMQHEIKETQRIIDFLGENENTVSNIRRLGKFTKSSSKPRSLLVTFNNSWTVRKLLANAHKIKYYNQDKGTTIFVSKSLTKEEQIKEKECLIKRYKLINEEGYLRNKFRIFNQKLYYDGTEIEVSQW